MPACKLAVEYDVPVINFDYPPAMGADSVDLALQVLAGNPVPKIYEVNVDVIVSKGDETTSIKADKWVEDYAPDGQARRADPLDRPWPGLRSIDLQGRLSAVSRCGPGAMARLPPRPVRPRFAG